MTMLEWLKGLPKAKKALPLLSFPSVALTGESVHTVTHDAIKQAEGVKAMLSQNCCCTVGSEKKVREDASHFMTVRDLLK